MSDITLPPGVGPLLRKAERLLVLTGAGISAESGLPTFREARTGLWARYRPEDLATPAAFRRDPGLVWRWYAWRRQLLARAAPNPGHHALVELARRVPELTLVTQNVDGLHQAAGSREVIELHGSLRRDRCEREGTVTQASGTGEEPPACPGCGSLLRPDVVWFGEPLPLESLERAMEAAARADLCLVVGTSGLVEPAASLPRIAHRSGATLVVVNVEGPGVADPRLIAVTGPASTVLPALLGAAWPDPDGPGPRAVRDPAR